MKPSRLGSSSSLEGTPLLSLRCLPLRRSKLRMPIFSYFLVVGGVLTGLLLWFGNGSGPIETSSHIIANVRHPQVQTGARGRAR